MASRIEGVERLKRRFENMPKAVQRETRQAVEGEANRVADRMRAVVPVEDGDLKESITVTTEGRKTPSYSHPSGSHIVPEGAAEITAGNGKVRYAHMVEYGTKKMQAEPFFWPTVRVERPKVRRNINKAIRKGLQEAKG
ncbi:HK97 gp10 family phage protein [Brevundimonas sp. 2R-24]|uniref:HK97 gp10 family phage protein n=1 Tax=Peiella sedimenti TaxID=3061083 RepID=A0ABT8SQN6_9CAUL|nr:HK97 gp10 family phage protein [Caulobacteraceae bacterium XZ-24]